MTDRVFRLTDYTGHPLVDIGLATLLAFAEEEALCDLTEADLDRAAAWMARNYVINPLRSFLTVVFPNSGYTQPAYNKYPGRRAIYVENVLSAYKADALSEIDAFLGLPVADVSYDVKGQLRHGRAYRQHIPLQTGEGVINFAPGGDAGTPMSGVAMLAIQAMPMGCAKCAGRLLGVHSDSTRILERFASHFLTENRRLVSLAQAQGLSKIEEPGKRVKTLLVTTLLECEEESKDEREMEEPYSVTAYHLSNSGQGPGLAIYNLPLPITRFLRLMRTAHYAAQWNRIVDRAWQLPRASKRKTGPFVPKYNALYEDLFALPQDGPRFIRCYLLRRPLRQMPDRQDPRSGYDIRSEADLASWDVTEAFLEEVMNVEKERIDCIRDMGDRLAEYVSGQNDRRFFRTFSVARQYWELRSALIRASRAEVSRGAPPLVEFDPYVAVFEDGSDQARVDWRLARDLVLIRMMEQLYKQKWLDTVRDEVFDETEPDTDE